MKTASFQPTLLSAQALLATATAIFLASESLGRGFFTVCIFAVYLAISGIYGLEPPIVFSLFGGSHFTTNLGLIRSTGVRAFERLML